MSQLVSLFLINGYAWDGSASIVQPSKGLDAAGAEFCLVLTAPATIWGGQALQQQRAKLVNDFLLKTAKVLVEQLGYRVVSSSIEYEGTKELSYLKLG